MSAIAFSAGATAAPALPWQPHPGVQPRLRITRRGRAVLALVIAIPLATGGAVAGLGAVGAAAGTPGSSEHGGAASFRYVTVQPGESLWQLARSVAPTADPRDVVADIQNLNDMGSGDIQPGQRIAIPAKYAR